MKFLLSWPPLFPRKVPDHVQMEIIKFLTFEDMEICFVVSKPFYKSLRSLGIFSYLHESNMFHNFIDYGKSDYLLLLLYHKYFSFFSDKNMTTVGSLLSSFLINQLLDSKHEFMWSLGFNHSILKLPHDKHFYSRGNNLFGQLCLNTKGIYYRFFHNHFSHYLLL